LGTKKSAFPEEEFEFTISPQPHYGMPVSRGIPADEKDRSQISTTFPRNTDRRVESQLSG
jgi:hypothetical protein